MKAYPYNEWGSPYCKNCVEKTDWYLKRNSEKKGHVLCKSCYEKSKLIVVYLHKPPENEVIYL